MSDRPIKKPVIALGVSGGIAAYKAVEVLRGLQQAGCEVVVAMTRHACEFISPLTFRALSGTHVIVDDYAVNNPDPIAHINFSQDSDLLLIAPATANIIAKFANGIADDFLSTSYLAAKGPVLVAPAMNTVMWEHPATSRNLETLRKDGVHVIQPDSGEMACKTVGPGRLSEPDMIVAAALELLRSGKGIKEHDFSGERLLITAGATREALDPIRFISNRSSGRMGFALGEAARARGAEVVIIAGSTTVDVPCGVRLVRAESAESMLNAVLAEVQNATVFIGAAAVSDFRPSHLSVEKIKKTDATLTITFERTADILAIVAERKHRGLLVVGFAAETSNVEQNAMIKLRGKKLDMIVANDVSAPGAGFDSLTNVVSIFSQTRIEPIRLAIMTKRETADGILDEIVNLRRRAIGESH